MQVGDRVTTSWEAVPGLHPLVGTIIDSRGVGLGEKTEDREFLIRFLTSVHIWIPRRYIHAKRDEAT